MFSLLSSNTSNSNELKLSKLVKNCILDLSFGQNLVRAVTKKFFDVTDDLTYSRSKILALPELYKHTL